ncbi:MAG: hypothetical protein K6D59_07900 [Bacteroidales bacterium]|nr:hypothetical protein [Bacteroidales bacterium]
MTYAVVLHLTSDSIKFLYMIGKNDFAHYPLDNDQLEMPLAFYVGNDRLQMGKFAIERAREKDVNAYTHYFDIINTDATFTIKGGIFPVDKLLVQGMEPFITSFLREKRSIPDSEIAAERSQMPLFLSFSNEITDDNAQHVLGVFYESGYNAVTQVSINESLFDILANSNRSKMMVTGRGGSIYLSFFPDKAQPAQFTTILEGYGQDPRIRVCANHIFDMISAKHPGIVINKEDNWELLTIEAQRVMESPNPVVMGKITFREGVSLDYMVMKAKLNALLANDSGAHNVLPEIDRALSNNGLQASQIDFILDGTMNSEYFVSLFKQRYSFVLPISEQAKNRVWNLFLNKLINGGEETPINIPNPNTIITTQTPANQTDVKQFGGSNPPTGGGGGPLPMPATLHLHDGDGQAVITWTKTGVGRLMIFCSENKFNYGKGDPVDINNLGGATNITPRDNQIVIEKDFCGQRYYLPIVENRGMCCAGDQVSLLSVLPPQGVMLDCNTATAMLRWEWNGIDGVRIKVKPDNSTLQCYDLFEAKNPMNNTAYSIPPNASTVEIAIASLIQEEGGNGYAESEYIRKTFSLRKVLVDFIEIKKGGILHKNKFSLFVSCGSELPCGLSVYAQEGSFPINIDQLQPITTVEKSQIVPGTPYEIALTYDRRTKGELFFRISAAEAEKRDAIIVNPEFRSIK